MIPRSRGGRVDSEFLVFFGAVWVLSAITSAAVIAPASVFPLIRADLAIGPTLAGWIISVMLGTQALTSVFSGMALDRWNNRRMITLGTVAFVGACVWSWQAALGGSYWLLLVGRAGSGVALMVVWNGGINMIGRAVASDVRATAIGIFSASAPAGFAAGQFVGPVVADAAGWAAIFAVLGGASIVSLAVFRTASRSREHDGAETAVPRFADFRRVFVSRHVWFVSVMGFMAFSLYSFLNSWMPSYLAEVHGLSLAESGLLVASFPAVGVLSRSGGGLLSDVVFGGRRRPVALLTFGVSAPFVAVLFFAPSTVVLVVALVAIGLFVQLGMGLFLTYIRELVEDNVNATAVAFLSGIAIFGAFTAPVIGGVLIETTGRYGTAFGYAGVVAVVGCAMALFAPEPGR